jgi:hypothetical protein
MSDVPKLSDVSPPKSGPPTDNPYRTPFGLNITFPEVVVIKMVDASALNDYEFAFLFSSIFASSAIGFFVAFLQAPPQEAKLYLIVAIIFGLCFVGFVLWARYKRNKMTAKSKTFTLQTTGVEEPSTH